jgi:hypothetical protein
MNRGLVYASAALLSLAAASLPRSAAAQSIDEEVTKQTTRQISESIARRITATAFAPVPGSPSDLPSVLWFTGSYTRLAVDDGGPDTNVFQTIFGFDRKFGDVFAGVSLAYARADTGGGGVDFEGESYSVTPYFAYVFNQNFFASGLFGYTYSDGDLGGSALGTGSGDLSSHSLFGELALNTVWTFDATQVKGKAGYRYSASDSDITLTTPTDDSSVGGAFSPGKSYSSTYFVGAELGYKIGGFTPYVRGLFEFVEPHGADSGIEKESLFLTAGLSYAFNQTISAGLGVQREVLQSDINNTQVFLEGRIRF